ncbi:enolase-phosphatase E1 [Tribolium madens]|uniref:enolase-phosphatase E1 n=1 Tax=Tribolium madens TaxID=41895 RepID=UPI001CF7405E|nr:enolase-phosphatase E1 [Tribolium madens]
MSSENESVSPPMNIEKYSLVLVDVAGTTTSINFVKDTLFPFVTKQAEPFLQKKWEEESIKDCIKLIQEGDANLDLAAAVERVKALTQEDSSNKGLKTLQGLIYKDGYEKGELKAHVFDDVPEAFETWAKNRRIAVYSTGSVDSQKLLFSNTVKGDLSAHISKYFDQSVGPKTEAESYKTIAKETGAKPEEIVFITDDPKEATAAKSGGLATVLMIREGNSPLSDEISKEFTTVNSFKDLEVDKASKRKIEEGPTSEEAPPSKVPKTDVEEKPTEEKAESMEIDAGKSETTETAKNETEQQTEKTESKEETIEITEPEEKMETVVAEAKVEVATEETNTTTEQEKPKETEEPKETEPDAKLGETKDATQDSKPAEEAKVTEKPDDTEKPVEEAQVSAETSIEETPEKTAADTSDTPVENSEGKTETVEKAEEKENKSVLANGVENGKEESETVTDAAESTEVKVDEVVEKIDETEVKVKKLEESAESKTVSVEV